MSVMIKAGTTNLRADRGGWVELFVVVLHRSLAIPASSEIMREELGSEDSPRMAASWKRADASSLHFRNFMRAKGTAIR